MAKKSSSPSRKETAKVVPGKKIHPWRPCPLGEYWRSRLSHQYGSLAVILLSAICVSFQWPPTRIGLLTDDYGIVTDQDLDEEERVAFPEPFPPKVGSFQYWMCLPTYDIFMKCNDTGPSDHEEEGQIGDHTFRLRTGNQIFNFYTRHNGPLDACEEMVSDWRDVIIGEEIVCISASYVGTNLDPANEERSNILNSDWVIDRMKSRHGEWSWFVRD